MLVFGESDDESARETSDIERAISGPPRRGRIASPCAPFDGAAFAAERSPIAELSQEERTQAVADLVREAASRSDGQVILVGHSAGGMTVSAVAELVPHLLGAVVYLAGFMVPNGLPLLAMLMHESMAAALAPRLFVGDPMAVGLSCYQTW